MPGKMGRAVIAVLVCLAIPAGSWLVDGRGRLAFNMYAATVWYRVEIAAIDERGAREAVDPTDVAENVSAPAAAFLRGAGDLRVAAQVDALRAHLADVARAACRGRSASAVEVTLVDDDARESERMTCPTSR